MLICSNCNIKYEEEKKYCKTCGTLLQNIVDKSETSTSADHKYSKDVEVSNNISSEVEDDKKQNCLDCGEQYEKEHKFCKNCGNSLTSINFENMNAKTQDKKDTNEAQNLWSQTKKETSKINDNGSTSQHTNYKKPILIILGILFVILIIGLLLSGDDKNEVVRNDKEEQRKLVEIQAEECFSDIEAKRVFSDLKNSLWTTKAQQKLDINYVLSQIIPKKDGQECIVLVESKNKGTYCRACPTTLGIVLYSNSGKNWKRKYEQKDVAKLGVFGVLPEPKIVQIGEDNFGIMFHLKSGSQGTSYESNTLIAKVGDKYKKVFNVQTHGGYYGSGSKNYEWNANVDFIEGENKKFFDIRVVSKGLGGNLEDGKWKIIPVNEINIYKFSQSEYELVEDKSESEQVYSNNMDGLNEELKTFVKNFISTINSRDLDKLMTFYNDFVQFHGKNYSLQEIRIDKENYFKKWTNLNFKINKEIEIINKDNVAKIDIPIEFLVENTKKNESLSGKTVEQ